MADAIKPDLTHIAFDEQGTEFLGAAFDDGDRRTLSGFGNNKNNPEFGAADQPFLRITESDFEDGVSAPRATGTNGDLLPNERLISNVIADQDDNGDGVEDVTTAPHDTNLFLMSFGQFFDHGLDFLKRSSDPNEKYFIQLDPSDPLYNDDLPANRNIITVTRGEEAVNSATGEVYVPREHFNETSPFIDQNQSYGSFDAVGYYLRLSDTNADGQLVRNSDDGSINKLAELKSGSVQDNSGFYGLPTYADILLNNGVSAETIAAALAMDNPREALDTLRADPNFVDFSNVRDPWTGELTGIPLLEDIAFDANPNIGPIPGMPDQFSLEKLLDHYVAGDGRVNENVGLTPIHTIFHRDHDHWVEQLREMRPEWSEDKLFESAKLIVGAEYQRVIFDEFIDAMAGSLPGPVPHGFDGYHPRVDAQISSEFAHSIYRVGHSMITEKMPFQTADGIQEVTLVEAFLNPSLFEELGVDALISGSTQVGHERIDENLVNAVRNQLLGRASDLAAINIARGREIGLQSLNDVRRELYEQGSKEVVNGSDVTRALQGNEELKPYASWDDFANNLRDPSLVELFKQVYNSVDDVDLWIGGLAEKPRSAEEGQMGTTFTWIFWEQMDRLQDGDAFYYEGFFSDTEILGALESQTFADIIMRNSGVEFLNDKVFNLSQQVRMDLAEKARTFSDANETIVGNNLDNEIRAGGGNDTVYGQDGNDIIYGEDGDDGLRGEAGDDEIHGGAGSDRVVGGDGNDLIYGDDDQDALNGNDGDDIIYGGDGHDEVHGNAGNDILYGEDGDDVIKGGLGDDWSYGGDGDDVIETNGGDDVVSTGKGNDVVLMSDDVGDVTITDFDEKKDRIDLRLFDVRNQEDLEAKVTITQAGKDTLLSVGNSTIRLENMKIDKIDHDNFKFDNDDQNLVLNGRMDERVIEVKDGEITLRPFDKKGTENQHSVGWKNQDDESVGYVSVKANRVLEIGTSDENGEIYQELPTDAGKAYSLSFDASANDKAKGSEAEFDVLWNGEVVATIEPGKEWQLTEVIVEGTGGLDRLSFQANGDNKSKAGALIDNVVVRPSDATPTDNTNVIVADAAGGYLTGTEGDDEFVGKAGIDVFYGGKGDDTYDGAGGSYNQVDLDGKAEDYTFTLNADGTVTAASDIYGTDTLKNINGIWFYGSSKWSALDDLIDDTATDPTQANVIETGDSGGYFTGTEGKDDFRGGAGNDVFNGGLGDDIYNGAGGNYNQVDYSGSASDYTFTRNDDGTVTISHPTDGTDLLKNIDGLWFGGEAKWYPLEELIDNGPTDPNAVNVIETGDAGGYFTGTAGTDDFRGGAGNDVFNGGLGDDIYDGAGGDYNQVDYSGSASDYAFTRNDDGTVSISHPTDGTDLLKNIDGLWFGGEAKWYALEDLIDNGPTDPNAVNVIETGDAGGYFTGTDGKDDFRGGGGNDVFNGGLGDDVYDGAGGDYNQVDLEGRLADYTFTSNPDGNLVASHAQYGEDILKNIDGIWIGQDEKWVSTDELMSSVA